MQFFPSLRRRLATALATLAFTGATFAATFTVTNTADSGAGSLRQAILDANATAGADVIEFNIASAGVQTITPATPLPTISETLTLNGYSQPGATANTLAVGSDAVILIELVGLNAGSNAAGFNIGANGVTIRGFAINRFQYGVLIDGPDNWTIQGNHLGTNAAGTADLGNQQGLFILDGASNGLIGGPNPADRNLISGNNNTGVTIGSTNTITVAGNYIGTNAQGTAAIGNTVGVGLNSASTITIGGAGSLGNLISGNNFGVTINNPSANNQVLGNLIGTQANGTSALPNGTGIHFSDGFSGTPTNTTVGTMAAPNTIAFNNNDGIVMETSLNTPPLQNAILYNSIHSNGQLGIDLHNDGVTANDFADGDGGANARQNFPVLSAANAANGNVTITGSLNSTPSTTFTVQFFHSTACDPSGNGEGESFIGETSVTTDAGGDASFVVSFPSAANGVITATATSSSGNTSEFSACRTIVPVATPSISISDVSVTEGNAGTVNAVFTVFLNATSATDVTVDFITADDSATTADSDYASNSGTVTITAGNISQTVTVVVNGDTNVEDIETFFVNLSNPTGGTISDSQGVGTILADDGLPAITISDVALAEGNAGTTAFSFAVNLSAPSAFPVSVSYSTADGTALSTSDYQSGSGTVNFAAGETTQNVVINVNGDTTFELNDTFVVNLFNPANATLGDAQATGTINNDDSTPSATIADVSTTEGNSGTKSLVFTVQLSNASHQTVSVFFNLTNGTATVGSDYNTNSGSFTFTPGQTSRTVSVGIIGDTTIEPDENFFLNLTSANGATISDNQAEATIINDDGLTQPGITISNTSVTEGDAGTVNAQFSVTLTGVFAGTVTVDYTTNDVTANAGSDYAPNSGTLTFLSGDVSETITVIVNGDTDIEANETFNVQLSNPVNGSILDGQGVGTITNDDGLAAPEISISDVTLAEGNAGTTNAVFNVTLSAGTASIVTVDYVTGDQTATAGSDYSASTGQVTFNPAETLKTIEIPVLGDGGIEADETFTVNLSNPTNSTIADNQGVATITNDDGLQTPAMSINDVTVTEGDAGTINAVFTVSLGSASAEVITADFSTADQTATAGSDYTAVTGTVTFPPDTTVQNVVVPVLGDTDVEPTELFAVNLTNVVNAVSVDPQGIGTITNDDAVVVPDLTISDISVTEGNAGTTSAVFTLTLSAATTAPVSVDFATADQTALAASDYNGISGSVVFAPGDTEQTVTVQVIGDALVEPNETFVVNLTNGVGANVTDSQGLGTITNDDSVVVPTVTIADVSIVEGNAGTTNLVFTVTLSAPSASNVTVDFSTADVSATAGADYTGVAGTVTITAGLTSQTIAVPIIGDLLVEGDETFVVNLANPTNATITDNQAVGTITDDDTDVAIPTLSEWALLALALAVAAIAALKLRA
jgi:hypothetical protein